MAASIARSVCLSTTLALAAFAAPAHALDAQLDVAVDRATVVRAPENTATIIIGNPLIADATTQKNGVMVVTGKSFGTTNIMLLDAKGAILSETTVSVRRAADGLVVQRGGKRESYSCTPRCEPVLAIGDNQESFAQTAGQISQRAGMSAGRTE